VFAQIGIMRALNGGAPDLASRRTRANGSRDHQIILI
jgi:hypothetical protein